MPAEILTEKREGAFIITFNRPDRGNAMSFDMANQLFQVLKPVTTDRAIRAVMLRGAGGNFMDGLDTALYTGDFNTAMEKANQMIQPYHSAIRELYVMDKPVLAAVDGITAGSGMSLMLASDLVIASRSAKFNCRFANYATTPDGGLSMAITRKAGSARAAQLMMLSDTFSAEEAEKCNLVNWVSDDAKFQEESLALLMRLASGATRSYAGIKKLIAKAFETDINGQLALEHTHWGASMKTFDFREAIRAEAAKRPAKYTGS